MSGVAKALWVIFLIAVPYLGVFVYLIARGGKMAEHRAADAKQAHDEFAGYVQQTAGVDTAGQREEFAAQKAKLLA